MCLGFVLNVKFKLHNLDLSVNQFFIIFKIKIQNTDLIIYNFINLIEIE